MMDNKSIVFGAVLHGKLKVRFHKDGAFQQAWYYDEDGSVKIIAWLEEGEVRSLASAGVPITQEQKPQTKAEAVVKKAVEQFNAGDFEDVTDDQDGTEPVSDEEMERLEKIVEDHVKGETNG